MYLPEHFREDDPRIAEAVIREHPLGTLITCDEDGLTANEIPFFLDTGTGEHGVLHGHVARANGVWRANLTVPEVLVVFRTSQAYISPTWYPSKQEHHRVVPTWNYVVVQARGPLVVHDDERWLRGQAGRLTKLMEAGRETPWKMGDAPRDYLEQMLANIVGIEIPVTSLVTKAKLGQNRTDVDREGAIAGLQHAGGASAAVAEAMQVSLERDRARR